MTAANPLQALLGKAIQLNHPVYASMELTFTCNMACTFCYNPVQRPGQNRARPAPIASRDPLSFEEIVAVLDELKAMGVLYLTLTGGEAMVHPRFWEIAEEAKKRTFALRIFSNGLLIDQAVADRLAALRPHCLEISIHGADDATAEALNKVPGSHTRLLQALALLKERELMVYLKCVVTKLTENQLPQIREIGLSFGYPVYFDSVLTISDDGQGYPLELQASDEGIRRLYSSDGLNIGVSPFERQKGNFNCSLAKGTLHIDPYGNVSPCIQWKEPTGNIRESSIHHIWTTSQELERIRQINATVNSSLEAQTPDHAFCAHCPGLSQLRYGDPLRPEEQYLRVARIRREVYESENKTKQEV